MGNTRILQPAFIVTDSLKRRFMRNVRLPSIDAPDLCHLWTGAGRGAGYGAFKHQGRVTDAHVFAWRLANGGAPVPVGQLVMHSCDVKLCVRPEHLMLGTHSQNMSGVRMQSTDIALCEFGESRTHGAGSVYLNAASGRWVARLSFRDGQRVEFSDRCQRMVHDKLEAFKRQLIAEDITTLDELPEAFRS